MPPPAVIETRLLRAEERFRDHRECDWALWEYLRHVEDEEGESFRVHAAFAEDGHLLGAAIVRRLEQSSFRMIDTLVEEEELAGPYFCPRALGRGLLLFESLWCEPGAPAAVFLSLVTAAAGEGLPVYASFVDERLERLFERRYAVAA